MDKDIIRLRAPAKVNLGLDVTGRNPDGYHDVKMIMQTIALSDRITINRQPPDSGITMEISTNDITIDISSIPTDDANLCIKAAKLMLEESGVSSGFHIILEKNIPQEAGLAGGSTDAAAVMVGINELLELGYTKDRLAELALTLGADIPFCIYGGTKLTEGIGEVFTDIEPPLSHEHLVLVKPPFGVSTGLIYQRIDELEDPIHPDIDGVARAISDQDYEAFAAKIDNIMERVVAPIYPDIDEIKVALKTAGCVLCSMSGSGTCVYGLFRDKELAAEAGSAMREQFPGYFVNVTETIDKGVSYD